MIGQTYAAMYPRRVRAIVLDGVVDPVAFTGGTAGSLALGFADADATFGKFESLCQSAGTRCALAGRGPVAPRVSALLERLREGPIGTLTYGDTLLVLWLRLGAPVEWPGLAAQLDEADRGDGAALEAPRATRRVSPWARSIRRLRCNAWTSRFRRSRDRRRGPA